MKKWVMEETIDGTYAVPADREWKYSMEGKQELKNGDMWYRAEEVDAEIKALNDNFEFQLAKSSREFEHFSKKSSEKFFKAKGEINRVSAELLALKRKECDWEIEVERLKGIIIENGLEGEL